MVQSDISLFLKQLSQIKLCDSIFCHHFHLKYKFRGYFFSYKQEVKMRYSGSGRRGGVKGIIKEANN